MNVFSAFPALLDRLPVDRRHLVHVGAHEGQEMPHYQRAGIGRVTLVEPHPQLAARLRVRFPHATVIQAACGQQTGTARLHVMRRSNMSTLATPAPGDQVTATVDVPVVRLADIAGDATIAVVDAQGLELEVLLGADLPGSGLQLLVVETCTVPDATMASPYDQVVDHMTGCGYTEVDRWVRDYRFVHKWARGVHTPHRGQIRDVIFLRA